MEAGLRQTHFTLITSTTTVLSNKGNSWGPVVERWAYFGGDTIEPVTLRDEKTHLLKIINNLCKRHRWGHGLSRCLYDREFWPEDHGEMTQLTAT